MGRPRGGEIAVATPGRGAAPPRAGAALASWRARPKFANRNARLRHEGGPVLSQAWNVEHRQQRLLQQRPQAVRTLREARGARAHGGRRVSRSGATRRGWALGGGGGARAGGGAWQAKGLRGWCGGRRRRAPLSRAGGGGCRRRIWGLSPSTGQGPGISGTGVCVRACGCCLCKRAYVHIGVAGGGPGPAYTLAEHARRRAKAHPSPQQARRARAVPTRPRPRSRAQAAAARLQSAAQQLSKPAPAHLALKLVGPQRLRPRRAPVLPRPPAAACGRRRLVPRGPLAGLEDRLAAQRRAARGG